MPSQAAGGVRAAGVASGPAGEAAGRIFSWTAFPVVMTTVVWVSIRMLDRGTEPGIAFLVPILAAYAFVIVAERIFPHQQEWLHSKKDVRVDAAWALTDATWIELLRPAIYAGGIGLGGWLTLRLGSPLWPRAWHPLAQLALALVVAELPKYWLHRLEHEQDWLWRFHATHHSVPRLYFLNASRFHPVDIGLDTILGVGTLVLLGCSEAIIALFLLVGAVHGVFQHANLRLRLGPLNWFFSMAELHRWHHSRRMEEANTNYGQNLIVWDVVFGTRYLPADREPPVDVGLADMPDFPQTFFAQLASPFRWSQLKREAAVSRAG